MLVPVETYEHLDGVGRFEELRAARRGVLRTDGRAADFPSEYAVLAGRPKFDLARPSIEPRFEVAVLDRVAYLGRRSFYDIARGSAPLGCFRNPRKATGTLEMPDLPPDAETVPGTTYCLDTRHSGHGHLLLEAFSQIWAAPEMRPDRLLVDRKCHRYFAPAITPIIEAPLVHYDRPVIFERLVLATPSYVLGDYISDRYLRDCHAVRDACDGADDEAPLLYVSRRNVRKRRMAAEAEIEELFREAGFRILVPEQVPFIEQIKAFARAQVVAGPVGSALYNVAFSRAGTRRLILAPDNFYTSNDLLLGAFTGSAPAYIFGDGPNRSVAEGMMDDWHLPLDRVRAGIAALGLPAPPRPGSCRPSSDPDRNAVDRPESMSSMASDASRPPNEDGLDAIGLRCGTDKASNGHDYLRFYEQFLRPLRERELTILEIGVLGGASLRMWEAYFPLATIVGADITPTAKRFEKNRIRIEIVDQSNVEELARLALRHGPFDLVIEDGSHIWDHQITSLRTLFPFVASDGIYIVEDLQTNYGALQDRFRGVSSISCVEYLKTWADLRIADSAIAINEIEDPFLRTYGQKIQFMAFHRRACLIRKQFVAQDRRVSPGEPLVGRHDDARSVPVGVLAYVAEKGSVLGDGYVNLGSDRHLLNGISLETADAVLEYRVYGSDRSWSEWCRDGTTAGAQRRRAPPLHGLSVRVRQAMRDQFTLKVVAAFAGRAEVVETTDGEDCTAPNGEPLRALQIVLRRRS